MVAVNTTAPSSSKVAWTSTTEQMTERRERDVQVTPSEKTTLDRQVEESLRNETVASVSVSEDGDVTSVSQSGMNALEDYEETSLKEEGRSTERIVREEQQKENYTTESTYEPEIDSLVGYTQQQVEQLYRDGRISYHKYEENMESRASRLEEQVEAFASRFDGTLTESIKGGTDTSEVAEQATRLERQEEEKGRLWDYQLQA